MAELAEVIDDNAGADHGCKFIPSQEQIRAMCRQIQDGWSQDEEQRRRAWTIPTELDYGRLARIGQ